MVFTLACPENSTCTYSNMMQMALRTILKDPGFSVSTSGKEAQTCSSDMLESLGAADNRTTEAAVQRISVGDFIVVDVVANVGQRSISTLCLKKYNFDDRFVSMTRVKSTVGRPAAGDRTI